MRRSQARSLRLQAICRSAATLLPTNGSTAASTRSAFVQSDVRVLWCANEICEERAADGTTVTRRAFARGEQIGDTRYFATDHLGSVSEVSDASAAVLGRYAFDPWGRRTLVSGSDITRVGFTGHRWQATESVWLTKYRALDSESGRWLSEDPIGFAGSDNFYEYADDSPVRYRDPNGLTVWVCVRDLHGLLRPVANHTYFWDDREQQMLRWLRSRIHGGGHKSSICGPGSDLDWSPASCPRSRFETR